MIRLMDVGWRGEVLMIGLWRDFIPILINFSLLYDKSK